MKTTGNIGFTSKEGSVIFKDPEEPKNVSIDDFKRFGDLVLLEIDTIPENKEEFGNLCYYLGQTREKIRQIYVKIKAGDNIDWELY